MPHPLPPIERATDGALSEQNRAMFRNTIPPEMWRQMAQYGMKLGEFPDWRSIQGISESEMPMLEALMMAFKDQEDQKRKKHPIFRSEYRDPLLDEATELAGGESEDDKKNREIEKRNREWLSGR